MKYRTKEALMTITWHSLKSDTVWKEEVGCNLVVKENGMGRHSDAAPCVALANGECSRELTNLDQLTEAWAMTHNDYFFTLEILKKRTMSSLKMSGKTCLPNTQLLKINLLTAVRLRLVTSICVSLFFWQYYWKGFLNKLSSGPNPLCPHPLQKQAFVDCYNNVTYFSRLSILILWSPCCCLHVCGC